MAHLKVIHTLSFLYAIQLFIFVELVLNIYRISRITNTSMTVTTNVLACLIGSIGIAFTLFVYHYTKKVSGAKRNKFWSTITWLPYFCLFIFLFAFIFPMEYQGDVPGGGTGLIIVGSVFLYPFYIVTMNFFVHVMVSDEELVAD